MINEQISRVEEPEVMTADFVVEHSIDIIQHSTGQIEVRIGVLADHDHFYPNAVLDEYGMSTGGWPTDAELEAHRRNSPKPKRWRR